MSKIDKKQKILDTALTLFVSQGYHETSTASIAKAAEVATGTLFHHFPSKSALINHLYLNIKQEFAMAIMSQAQDHGSLRLNAEHLWNVAINWAINHPSQQAFFQQYALSSLINDDVRQHAMTQILSFMSELIVSGQKSGVLALYPLSLILEGCHGQYLASTQYFLNNPEKWQDTTHKQASFSMLWNAIKA